MKLRRQRSKSWAACPRVPLRGEGRCEFGGASWYSTGFVTMEEGLISSGRRNLRLPLRFWLGSHGPCRVGTRESHLVFCWGMDLRLPFELFTGWQATCRNVCGTCGFFWTMHAGVSAPSSCAFIHRFSFKEVCWHRVLFKSGPWNWGLSTCGTTHEATSRTSSWDRHHPEVRR